MDAMGNAKLTVNSKFTKAVAAANAQKPLNEVVVGPIDLATTGKRLELDPTILKMRKASEALGSRGYNTGYGYGYAPVPEHNSWVGAVAGGVADAAKTGLRMGQTLLTGEVPTNSSGKEHSWTVPRSQTLATMPKELYRAFHQNMASVEHPELVKAYNSSLEQINTRPRSSNCSNELH